MYWQPILFYSPHPTSLMGLKKLHIYKLMDSLSECGLRPTKVCAFKKSSDHRFSHHSLQVLLYLPPVQVWLSESLAKHANMGKASLYHLLVVSSLWLPVFLHQCSGKVIMGIGVNPNKAFQLLTRNFREDLIYLVKICICAHTM